MDKKGIMKVILPTLDTLQEKKKKNSNYRHIVYFEDEKEFEKAMEKSREAFKKFEKKINVTVENGIKCYTLTK